jgi:hypothetical protein
MLLKNNEIKKYCKFCEKDWQAEEDKCFSLERDKIESAKSRINEVQDYNSGHSDNSQSSKNSN